MRRHEVISGGTLIAVSAAYFVGTMGLPDGQGEPGPAFLPRVLAVALCALGVAILVGGVRSDSTVGASTADLPTASGPFESEPGLGDTKVWAAVAGTFLYVGLFDPLGFVLSTLAYTFGLTVLTGRAGSRLRFVVPPLCTLGLYLFFRIGLGVRLPRGLLG